MPPFHVKNHEARTVLLPAQTLQALLAWQAKAPEGVPYILLTAERWQLVEKKWRKCRAGEPWLRRKSGEMIHAEWENRHMVNNVVRDMRSHVKRAGLKLAAPLTVHTLRKSFGQNHANAGTPIHVLQRLMGHASITTTREFYLQNADANEREAVARYQTLLGAVLPETCVKLACYASSDDSSPTTISVSDCPEVT